MERIRLDIIPKGLMPVCHASQYDAGRVIRLDLMDGLQGYSLTDEEIELNVRKPDGHIVTASVDVVEGQTYVDIVTTEQMCAVEGENICELKISKDDAEIYSLNFRMMVEKSVTEGGDPSESFIHNLRTQIAEGVAEEVATQYDSSNVIFDNAPTSGHGTPYTVTSEGIKTAIDNAFDYDNTASGSIVHITDGADNIPVKSLVSQIVAVESGNGQPKSPDNPYSISGFDSGIITRLGANLWSSGDVTFTGATREVSISLAPKTYYFSAIITTNDTDANTCSLVVYYTDNTYLVVSGLERDKRIFTSFTTTKDVAKIALYSSDNYAHGSGDTATWSDILISENGTTYTFTFGQTVYGGYFDNKGNLVVTWVGYNMADLEWSQNPNNQSIFNGVLPSRCKTRLTSSFNSTEYIQTDSGTALTLNNSVSIAASTTVVYCHDERYTNVTDFKNGVTAFLIYELANPITLAITSQDIPTLLGENCIFSNCGNLEVNYYTSKSNDILEFINSEIGKKNGTNIPIEENSQDSIKTYIDNEVSGINATNLPISSDDTTSTKDYVDNSINAPIKASEVHAFTSLVGTTWEEGCYYIKRNGLVIVHISLQGLTANARNDIFTLPTDCKPSNQIVGTGRGGSSYTAFAQASVTTSGQLQISSVDTYAKIHFMYYVDE